MKLNDFENSALHTSEPPVGDEADALASHSPAALPTSAPEIILCPTRAELHARWQDRPEFDAANKRWHELLNHLAAFHPMPGRN